MRERKRQGGEAGDEVQGGKEDWRGGGRGREGGGRESRTAGGKEREGGEGGEGGRASGRGMRRGEPHIQCQNQNTGWPPGPTAKGCQVVLAKTLVLRQGPGKNSARALRGVGAVEDGKTFRLGTFGTSGIVARERVEALFLKNI
jgi:hypothetical protein